MPMSPPSEELKDEREGAVSVSEPVLELLLLKEVLESEDVSVPSFSLGA